MLNNCTFQGRFAADPEMRTTQSGLTVASFRMAVDRDNVGSGWPAGYRLAEFRGMA